MLQAEVPLEDLFVNEGHHDDERNILIDDLGLKRVRLYDYMLSNKIESASEQFTF